MSRKLELFQVFYRLKHDSNVLRFRFCLAFNPCHSTQVLIRSLVAEGVSLDDIQYEKSDFLVSYR